MAWQKYSGRGRSDTNLATLSLQSAPDVGKRKVGRGGGRKIHEMSRQFHQISRSQTASGGLSPAVSSQRIPLAPGGGRLFERSVSHTEGTRHHDHHRYYSVDSTDRASSGNLLSLSSSRSYMLSQSSFSSTGHSRVSSQDFSPVPLQSLSGDEQAVFDRSEFGQELEAIGKEINACNYLYLRRLLIKVLIDPNLQGLRDRLAELSADSEELKTLAGLINKVRSRSLSEKPTQREEQQTAFEKSFLQEIEVLFPTFQVVPAAREHMWTERYDEKGNLDLNNAELRSKMGELMAMLRPLSGENGLEEGEITDVAGYNRPQVSVPALQQHASGADYVIPVEFVFTLDGKAVKLPQKDLRALSLRNFIRLHYAKQSTILNTDEWNSLPQKTQTLLAGEMLNDDISTRNDTERFDCKFVVARGDQLPSGAVFSSREFRDEYDKKRTEKIDREVAEWKAWMGTLSAEQSLELERAVKAKYNTSNATGQMFMNVLKHEGGFSDSELQFVRGFLHQGAINEVLEYCCSVYFPERKVPFQAATLSEEANRDAARTAKMEVIDWGDNILEIVCEFNYDRYNISPTDRQRFKGDTTVQVRATAGSYGGQVQLSQVTMDVKVQRRFSKTEKLNYWFKKKGAVEANLRRARDSKEDVSRELMICKKKIKQARRGQVNEIAVQMMNDRGLVERFVESPDEQALIRSVLEKETGKKYSKEDKKEALSNALSSCQSLKRPNLGVLYPLPSWIHTMKKDATDGTKEEVSVLDSESGRLLYTDENGYVITNYSREVTEAMEGIAPKSKHAISTDDLIKIGSARPGSGREESSASSADEGEPIIPVRRLRPRYSTRISDYQREMSDKSLTAESKSKLCEHLGVPHGSGERVIMEKVKQRIGANFQQEEWKENLRQLYKSAGLDKKEVRKALSFTTAHFEYLPSFKRQSSLSSLANPGVVTEDDQIEERRRRLNGRAMLTASFQDICRSDEGDDRHQKMALSYSDSNLLDGSRMSPLMEEPCTPVRTAGPKITVALADNDDCETLLPSLPAESKDAPESTTVASGCAHSNMMEIVDGHIQKTWEGLKGITATGRGTASVKVAYMHQMRRNLAEYLFQQKAGNTEVGEMLAHFDGQVAIVPGTDV